jgi:N-acetyl-anhydromuramyl-L-alanine amidase AmpD
MSVQIIGALTARTLPSRDPSTICAVIVHTTGDTDAAKIMAFYRAPDGLCPHYMIAYDGAIYRIAWEDQIAWHCKIDPAEARLYQLGYSEWSTWAWQNDRPVNTGSEYPGYRQWRDTWRAAGLQSPLELITGSHPNSSSVGVELQQPVNPTADIFTDAQYSALAALLVDVGSRTRISLTREHVLGHSDCSPMRRCNTRGSWDPGRDFSYNRLWDEIGTLIL